MQNWNDGKLIFCIVEKIAQLTVRLTMCSKKSSPTSKKKHLGQQIAVNKAHISANPNKGFHCIRPPWHSFDLAKKNCLSGFLNWPNCYLAVCILTNRVIIYVAEAWTTIESEEAIPCSYECAELPQIFFAILRDLILKANLLHQHYGGTGTWLRTTVTTMSIKGNRKLSWFQRVTLVQRKERKKGK